MNFYANGIKIGENKIIIKKNNKFNKMGNKIKLKS